MISLKPCPFCGGKASIRRERGNREWHEYLLVGCERCDIWSIDDTEAKCESFWNRRSDVIAPPHPGREEKQQ